MTNPSIAKKAGDDSLFVRVAGKVLTFVIQPKAHTNYATGTVMQVVSAGSYKMEFPVIEKDMWEIITTKYKSRVFSATLIGLVGISDLMFYLLSSKPYLHWFTDLILLLGSIGLLIVIGLKAMEDAGEI